MAKGSRRFVITSSSSDKGSCPCQSVEYLISAAIVAGSGSVRRHALLDEAQVGQEWSMDGDKTPQDKSRVLRFLEQSLLYAAHTHCIFYMTRLKMCDLKVGGNPDLSALAR